jgi:putative nucleotidyltransferase with HDIG domain
MPTYEDALKLLFEYTESENLRRHAFAVESAMRAYARKFGEDEEKWAIVGLLHDFDYEKFPTPDQHPWVGSKILEERGYPEDIRKAILGHADYTGVPRDTLMAKVLYACDELCGFITAVALVRPNKKLKDKAFARSVNREDIYKGDEELGIPLDEHIQFVIDAMKSIADKLGL